MRKFEKITILKSINVSSSGHYTGDVYYQEFKGEALVRRWHRYYDLDGFAFLSENQQWAWWKAPAYLDIEVKAQFLELLKTDQAKFFEYDRDKNKRYENLRYHDPDHVKWMIERLEQMLTDAGAQRA